MSTANLALRKRAISIAMPLVTLIGLLVLETVNEPEVITYAARPRKAKLAGSAWRSSRRT